MAVFWALAPILALPLKPPKPKKELRELNGFSWATLRQDFGPTERVKVASFQCIVKPIPRPNATTDTHTSNDMTAAALAGNGVCWLLPQRATSPTPTM